MTKLLINIVKRRGAEKQREEFGLLSGRVGIICNLLLSAVKFTVGVLTGALSVTADAVNNLTDASVNIVTIIGTRLAGKPVDKEHPFGHGRAEYISALIVSFSVFIMSFELGKSAVIKIIRPERVRYSAVYVVILALSICVKLWMAYFNSRLYAITENLNMKAVMRDSLNDCVATLATLAAVIVSGRLGLLWFDGVIGLAVAVFVFFSGVSVLKEIIGALLGKPPSKELTEEIENIIISNDLILGVHDLIVHNYGHETAIASAHAEVPADTDLITVHEVIDSAEREIMEKLGINICIHTDPVETDNDLRERYKTLTEIIISEYNPDFSFHDFRLVEKQGKTVLSFDLVTPFEYEGREEEIKNGLCEIYKKQLPETELKINIEHSYI